MIGGGGGCSKTMCGANIGTSSTGSTLMVTSSSRATSLSRKIAKTAGASPTWAASIASTGTAGASSTGTAWISPSSKTSGGTG